MEIVQTIITLANRLGIKVIAEGIETKEQLNRLIKLGCKMGQGNHIAKPMNSSSVEIFLGKLSSVPMGSMHEPVLQQQTMM
jgi:EAL domain-containing protein (putative c-di-GMP-specific phosphodiesterase class I)